jgi:hypothetical protein
MSDDPRLKHFMQAIHGPAEQWEHYYNRDAPRRCSSLGTRVRPNYDSDTEDEAASPQGGSAPTTPTQPIPSKRAEPEGAALAAHAEPVPDRKEPFSAVSTLAPSQRPRVRSSLAPVPLFKTMPHFSAVKAPNFSAVEEVKRLQRKRSNPFPAGVLEKAVLPRQIPWKKAKPDVIDLTQEDEPKPRPLVIQCPEAAKRVFVKFGLNMFWWRHLDWATDIYLNTFKWSQEERVEQAKMLGDLHQDQLARQ